MEPKVISAIGIEFIGSINGRSVSVKQEQEDSFILGRRYGAPPNKLKITWQFGSQGMLQRVAFKRDNFDRGKLVPYSGIYLEVCGGQEELRAIDELAEKDLRDYEQRLIDRPKIEAHLNIISKGYLYAHRLDSLLRSGVIMNTFELTSKQRGLELITKYSGLRVLVSRVAKIEPTGITSLNSEMDRVRVDYRETVIPIDPVETSSPSLITTRS